MKQGMDDMVAQPSSTEAKATPQFNYQMEVWKKTIEVQQHFNSLGLQVQNFAISVLVAVVGAGLIDLIKLTPVTLTVTEGLTLRIPSTVLLLLVGLLVWLAFWFVDRWYFRLLIGAVRHGQALEDSLKEHIPNIGLTTSISNISNERWLGSRRLGSLRARFLGGTNLVYIGGMVVLIFLILVQYFFVQEARL